MTKEQIRKLLPAIEKARQKVRDTQKAEFEDLTKFDGRADAALSAAINKGSVPTQAQLDEFSALFGALRMRRTQVAEENAENVCTVLMGILNAGQTKAASNQLNPKRFNPDIKVEELKTEDKVRIYCREVLLHPLAYDLLVKMSK